MPPERAVAITASPPPNPSQPNPPFRRLILDSELDIGEVEFSPWNIMKQQVLYQGTASAVPKNKALAGH